MKKLFTLFWLMLFAVSLSAMPVKPGLKRTLTLSNGATVEATLVGDEHGHFFLADDGQAYRRVKGTSYYAPIDASDAIVKARQRRAMVNKSRTKRLNQARVGAVGEYKGAKKGIVILVNYSDVQFKATHNQAFFTRMANEENFSDGDFKGSMYDYFKAQSEGQFELTFDVVGPVTVSKTQAYYGTNDSYDQDEHAAEMVIEAVNLAKDLVNFADYDWDGDGYVDQVYVIYAGQGEADGGAEETIWPHAYDLYSANYYGDGSGPVSVDGVKVNTYACGPELNGSSNIEGIGTMCHEFSHCLGYPDFYDIDYSGGQGMYSWDLMDNGSYNDDGYQPAGYTSYEKWMAGWRTPITLSASQTVTGMKALSEGGDFYIIYNDNNANEYFMLENRQQTGWDTSLPGSGLLIVHVDYDESVWEANGPNDDPSHQRMTWVPSDGNYNASKETYGSTIYVSITDANLANDLWPNSGNKNFGLESYGNTTAKLYNQTTAGTYYLDVSVEDITQNADGTISFNFKGVSSIATPEFSPKAGVYKEAQNVSISCATEGANIYYTLDGSEPTTSSTLYAGPITVTETTVIKALAEKDGEESRVATGRFTIRAGVATTFKKVTSVSDLQDGQQYIIASDAKLKAAGALNTSYNYLAPCDVTMADDIITVGDDVTVFTLEGSGSSWSLYNDEYGYLYATAAKKMAYSTTAQPWTMSDDGGVIMTFGSYGRILYNVGSPRFTTYTSSTSTTMLYAYLYAAVDATPATTVEAPVFSPAGGTYTSAQNVTLTTATTGANIYYTLDGSNPTTSSTLYAGPIAVSETTTIKAIAEKDGTLSTVASATYTITTAVSGTTFRRLTSLSEMVSGANYIIACESKAVAAGGMDGDKLTPETVTVDGDIITITSDVSVFKMEGSGTSWSIYKEGSGYLYAMTTKKVDYDTDAASWTLAENDGITLTFGSYGTMLYNTGSPRFTTYTSSPSKTMIQAHLYIAAESSAPATVAAPTFTPAAGTYTEAQSVAIACATSGATIYYTTDGSEPTTASPVYTAPIDVSESMTLKAIAELDGTTSAVATATYVIDTTPTPDTTLKFKKVTEVTVGKRYLIVYDISGTLKAQNEYSGSKTYGYLYANTTVAPVDDIISIDDETTYFTFEEASGGFYIKDNTGRYHYSQASYNNFNLTTSVPASGGVWTATADADGKMTIKNTETDKWLQYNTSYTSTGAYNTAQANGILPYLYEETVLTGIDNPQIDEPALQKGVYTLQGRRLQSADNLPSGIYIINGRKVLVP